MDEESRPLNDPRDQYWKEYWAKKLDKNCTKCSWSVHDVNTLLISCTLGKPIGNTWIAAHNCREYVDEQTIKEKKDKQLDLFINNN